MTEQSSTGPSGSTIIRASAGTGKTQRLATRYLQLLNAGVHPGNILAVTFTRKAAGEIFARVIERLVQGALDDGKLPDLAADLQQPNFDRARCLGLLADLTARIHGVNVGTLDHYFSQQLRSTVAGGATIASRSIAEESTINRIRLDAIATLLQERAAALSPLIRLLNRGAASRGVVGRIQGVVAAAHQLYLESARFGEDAWSHPVPSGRLDALSIVEAVKVLREFTDLSLRFAKARDDAIVAIENEDWGKFVRSGIAPKILEGATFHRAPIPPALELAYRPLITHACAVLTAEVCDYTRAAFDLLQHFDQEYERIKERLRLATFDDLPRYLTNSIGAEARNGTLWDDPKIKHLLLDEFQDTSLAQWRALEAMARRTASQPEMSFLCVGDAKQSIYGWRGGVPELLTSLPVFLPEAVPDDLFKSYRSSPVIIEFVNQVFGNASNYAGKETYCRAIQSWCRNFRKHTTERDYDGHVTLRTLPNEEDDSIPAACELVESIRIDRPDATIALLVMTNEQVADTIYQLRQRGLEASEEGGQPLTDSAAVQALLSMLQLADHPGDSAARFQLAHGPLGAYITAEPKERADNSPMDETTREWRRLLFTNGLGPTLEQWSHSLAEFCSDADWLRVQQLLQRAEDWDAQGWTALSDFVEFIESERVGRPSGASIQVMTVHKAKGLQFDVVVLLGLEKQLIQSPSFAYDRDPSSLDIRHVLHYVNQSEQTALPTEMTSILDQSIERLVRERMCVLYVAVTRAIHALHIIIKSGTKSADTSTSLAGFVCAALVPGANATPDTILWELGSEDWQLARAPADDYCPDIAPAPEFRDPTGGTIDAETASLWTRPPSCPVSFQSPSAMEGDAVVAVAELFRPQRERRRDLGSLVHAMMEPIEWLAAGGNSSSQLKEAISQARLAEEVDEELLAQWNRWLRTDAVCRILDREQYVSTLPDWIQEQLRTGTLQLEVRNEQPILAELPDGRDGFAAGERSIGFGIMDRLILVRDEDVPVWAHVIDYKSDNVTADQLASRVDYYRPQLLGYRDLVAKALILPHDQVRTELCFLAAGMLVRIS